MTWTAIWISWLAFLVVADIIANRRVGATFSEHCRLWFSSVEGRIILAMFFIVLFFHLTFGIGVIPVISCGVGVVIMIVIGLRKRQK